MSTAPKARPIESIATLQSQLTSLFGTYPAVTEAVGLYDMSTNTTYTFGSTSPMFGSNTTKVIIAADYLSQVQEGRSTLTQIINGTSAEDLLNAMIEENIDTTSDKASLALVSYLTPEQIDSYAQSIGLTSYHTNSDTITAQDEATILQKLSTGSLLNKENTALLLNYLAHDTAQELIPAALPGGATVYHEAGYANGYLDDAAIVTFDNKSFVLVIYTYNTNDSLSSRENLLHAITLDAVEFVNSQRVSHP